MGGPQEVGSPRQGPIADRPCDADPRGHRPLGCYLLDLWGPVSRLESVCVCVVWVGVSSAPGTCAGYRSAARGARTLERGALSPAGSRALASAIP